MKIDSSNKPLINLLLKRDSDVTPSLYKISPSSALSSSTVGVSEDFLKSLKIFKNISYSRKVELSSWHFWYAKSKVRDWFKIESSSPLLQITFAVISSLSQGSTYKSRLVLEPNSSWILSLSGSSMLSGLTTTLNGQIDEKALKVYWSVIQFL